MGRDPFQYYFELGWKKVLDFLWEKAKVRIRLEGRTHFGRYLFVMFGDQILLFMYGWLLSSFAKARSKPQYMSECQELLVRFQRLHIRYHQFIGRKPCRVCYAIILLDKYLKEYAKTH